MDHHRATDILDFWKAAGPSAWWRKDDKFDSKIRNKFGDLLKPAANRELDHWREEPDSCLALILILDQFSRNLFRGSDMAFAQDSYALELAKYAVEKGFDKNEPGEIFDFLYMPFMHSENREDQSTCVNLFRAKNNPGSLKAAIEHQDIIDRFGRFPHRNRVLDRETTDKEQTFLDDGGFSG